VSAERLTDVESSFDVTNLYNRRAVNRWERTSVGDLLERVTWSFPDKEAMVAAAGAFADPRLGRLTYREADRLANQVANALLARGLGRGDVILLFCENSIEGVLLKLGIAKAGLVAAPVNPMMAPDMIAAMIDLVRPRLAVVDAEFWPRVEQPFGDSDLEVAVTITIGGDPVPGSVSFTDFLAGQPADEPDVAIHGDDIWEILFTSGTTALPKGVMISHTNSYLAALGFAQSLTRGLRIENELRLCTYLPVLYHVGDQPFLYSVFLSAGTLLIGRRPDATAIARSICGERLTALWAGSPAMVAAIDQALSADASLDATCLKVVVYGWAALPPATLASMKRHCGPDLLAFEIFGQTESITCHRFWPDKWPDLYARTAPQQNYVGVPSPLLASMVMDLDGTDLSAKPGVAGEAVYRSPAMMAGYYRDEAATREAFRYGWFHSGDSCAYDADGLRVMLDRYKDIIKSGGENVSSLRVEAVLGQHPDVATAVVIGLPHPRWGEAVTAVVVPMPGTDPDPRQIIEFCRQTLAGYETPKDIIFAPSLPQTVGGKVLKYKLRAGYSEHFDGQQ
jgi:acyl-CoA synthetase (AMP-forming)/AMP-acid ligase II